MKRKLLIITSLAMIMVGAIALWQSSVIHGAAENNTASWEVFFSPKGGCTAAIEDELASAKKIILVQAYSFTSEPIADALVDAKKRGVIVEAILDKSQRSESSQASTLLKAGIPVYIDAEHAIAHNKVIVIDGSTVITGSFNFSKAAEESNAENLIILDSDDLANKYAENIELHRQHSERFNGVETTKKTPKNETSTGGSYIGNKNSHIFHLPTCSSLPATNNRVNFESRDAAINAGYMPCKRCKP